MTVEPELDVWFNREVRPHEAAYRRAAYSISRDRHISEDLVQDAYLKVVANDQWRHLASPKAFVLAVIRNLAIDLARRTSRGPVDRSVDLEKLAVADLAPTPEASADQNQRLARIEAALDSLPPQCQRVVRLRKIEGLSPIEIAVRLDISVSTVEKHLSKAMRLLTERLAPEPPPASECRIIPWPQPRNLPRRS
ncbi:RNA polymerase sigma factor [Brevundimonas albigilva]|uniref:RNA polymerase sigma factor n=1 Tax=Brevundimonas albigilva TaxID=1312364 RepID=UPI00201B6A57|nr:RNA polymerase sigma factor [Brevundimonas albigilva]UQV18949.1 RNA polymerase sigma factor [Brevundimonas albigilva]